MFHIKAPVTEDSEVTGLSYNGVIQDWELKICSTGHYTLLLLCCLFKGEENLETHFTVVF